MGWPCAKAGQTELTGLDSDLEMHTGGLLRAYLCVPALYHSHGLYPITVWDRSMDPGPERGFYFQTATSKVRPCPRPATASPLIHKLSVPLCAEEGQPPPHLTKRA